MIDYSYKQVTPHVAIDMETFNDDLSIWETVSALGGYRCHLLTTPCPD